MMDDDAQMDTPDQPTLEDHPGLDNDEATEAGRMMTASGSTGPPDTDDHEEAIEKEARASSEKSTRRQENARREPFGS